MLNERIGPTTARFAVLGASLPLKVQAMMKEKAGLEK